MSALETIAAREMSALEAIAALKNVSLRQARRWCVDRRMPGADHRPDWRIPARKRHGYWHVDQQWIDRVIQREENKKVFQAIYGHGPRDKRAFVATLALHDIRDGRDWQTLRRYFPKKFRFLYCNYRHHRKAYRIADDPRAFLRLQIQLAIQKHGLLSVTALAKNLSVSKSRLYRAMPGLAKTLKRRHLDDPTVPAGRRPAKMRSKFLDL
jgi:hypothetical protein